MDEHISRKLISELRERTLRLMMGGLAVVGFIAGISDTNVVIIPLAGISLLCLMAAALVLAEKHLTLTAWVVNLGVLISRRTVRRAGSRVSRIRYPDSIQLFVRIRSCWISSMATTWPMEGRSRNSASWPPTCPVDPSRL